MDGLLVYHVLPTLGWIELKSDPLNPMDACWLPPDPARPVARARTLHAESPRSAHLGNREWTGGSSQQQTGRNVKFTIQLVHSISIQLINLHQNHQKNERWRKKNGNSLEHPPWCYINGAAFAEAWGRNSDCALAQTQSAPRQMALSGEASDFIGEAMVKPRPWLGNQWKSSNYPLVI